MIFVACLAVYLASGRARAEVDSIPAPYAAWSFVRHGTFDLRSQAAYLNHQVGAVVIQRPNGVWISKYPPGSTWAVLPLVAPMAAIRSDPPSPNTMFFIGKLAASVHSAAAAALFYFACRMVAAPSAIVATILFALGTSMWSTASQALWMHGPATFWLCVALYVLVVHGEHAVVWRWALVGLALGMAIATRPTTVLFGISTGAIIWSHVGRKGLASLVAGALIPLGLYLLYTLVYFGPRFLCETMPVLCLLFGLAYARFSNQTARRVARTLVAVSVAVHFLGVFGSHPGWYDRQPPEELQSLFTLRDSHIEANAGVLLDKLRAKLRRDPRDAQ